MLFLQGRIVPNSDCLVQGTGNDNALGTGTWMKGCTHYVVRVSSDNCNAGPALPIPNAHCLVIGGRDDPGEFCVKGHGTDIVNMSLKGVGAFLEFVVPESDFVVVRGACKDWLAGMEDYRAHRPSVAVSGKLLVE